MIRVRQIPLAAVAADRMLVDGLRAWLRSTPDLRLVVAAATVDDLLAGPGRDASVAVLALRGWDGPQSADSIGRLAAAGLRVLVVCDLPDRRQAAQAQLAGARGYLSREHDLTSLGRAVRHLAVGGTVFPAEPSGRREGTADPVRPRLSQQEHAVLVAYASGQTLESTARISGIKAGTAKEYLDRVKAKYRAANRPARTKSELAQRAREDGMIP